jgi:hypothetical protein
MSPDLPAPPSTDARRGPWGLRPGAPPDGRVLFYAEPVPDVAVAFSILAILLGAPVALVAIELLLVLAAVTGLVAWTHVRSRRFEVTPTHVRIRRVPFAAAEMIPLERVRWARGGPLDPKAREGLEMLEMGVAEEAGAVRCLILVGLREAGEAAAAVLAVRDGRVTLPAA